MKAIRIVAIGHPAVEEDVPRPVPRAGEVLVSVSAAGICHSDAHYRAGTGSLLPPRTPGHEVAGVITAIGAGVTELAIGDRVAAHYLRSCGTCRQCLGRGEQFCETGTMLGKDFDGGYAEAVVIPARNAVRIPENVRDEHAAIMMCSTATAFHALRLASLAPGQSVAILGFGGLGISALLLARALGAASVLAVDVIAEKLEIARRLGALPIRGGETLTADLLAATDGLGVDVAIDFAGRAEVSAAAVRALTPGGTLVLVAITDTPIPVSPYRDLLARERRIIGCSDHRREELDELMTMASRGELDLSPAVSGTVPLDATAINRVLDQLDHGTATMRTVIVP